MYELSLKNDKEGMSMVQIIVMICLSIGILLANPCMAAGAKVQSVRMIINLPSSTLTLFSGEGEIKEYPVAIGKSSTPTPVGSYSIYYKEVNPTWIPPGKNYIVPSGPDNPLGYRWLEFLPTYGVHGTNAPWSIGQSVSNGCVRMYEEDVEELYEKIKVGTLLVVGYERVAVDIDKQGHITVMIYPDVYGYEPEIFHELEQKLATIGVGGWVDEE